MRPHRGPTPVACHLELYLRGCMAPRQCRRHDEYSVPRIRSLNVTTVNNAPPLTSRYEEDRRDPNVITNDLDEAQSRQLSTEPSLQRSNRPVARPLTLPSWRDYGFQPLDPAETAHRAALQLLDTYVCGLSAATADQQRDGTRSASAS
ncbi:hypothetical protein PC121_g20409 [Phytophthora cactorum]|nr:hypothetical protein PC120_g21253 [Phytophthora cactorum]KAG3046863.1 hypothetical protein PC121_g20409 [Phytophthora cactorum]KAG4042761.1 hypothetical protein PC123_g21757 [Phytophthora cactorum]